ncbi:unnamed protein product [Pleuronectes platessa]|uniref:Uncharacterized protein n=1 Tax=Pleuronectes platessa TaxID=8262 RepID=A0A9N7VQD6_PLEPL|nr:unnamed protein product [Pleuronectes platessa]
MSTLPREPGHSPPTNRLSESKAVPPRSAQGPLLLAGRPCQSDVYRAASASYVFEAVRVFSVEKRPGAADLHRTMRRNLL